MLTLVKHDEIKIVKNEKSNSENGSNIVSITSKSKNNKRSQENVLIAAKKLKW